MCEDCIYKGSALHDIIDCLVTALEARDAYTAGHSGRVADLTLMIGTLLEIPEEDLLEVHIAAHLHDIGKIGVPEQVLNKPGKLEPHEMACIREHSRIGHSILSRATSLNRISEIVLYHHEWWNGGGYPKGISGSEIPLGSRIIAVADAIDAMVTQRPYRRPLSWDTCYLEIENGCRTQFDPFIVEKVIGNWEMIQKQYHMEAKTPVLLGIA